MRRAILASCALHGGVVLASAWTARAPEVAPGMMQVAMELAPSPASVPHLVASPQPAPKPAPKPAPQSTLQPAPDAARAAVPHPVPSPQLAPQPAPQPASAATRAAPLTPALSQRERAMAQAAPLSRPEGRGEGPSPPPPGTAPPPAHAWLDAVSAWIAVHKRYPEAARDDGAEGDAVLRFTVARDGRVQAVDLASGSGSALLDDAATGLLRGATVPAFPPEMAATAQTVTFTLHYVLPR